MIRRLEFHLPDFKRININQTALDAYEITNITLIPLLFQTGYLTFKAHDVLTGYYALSYPNREVEAAFNHHLLVEFSEKQPDLTSSILYDLYNVLKENNIEQFIEILKSLYAGISYHLVDDKEKYYHSLFYITMRLLGFMIDCEVNTNKGRIDAVIRTETHIYVIEFKMGDGKTALKQIQDNQYAQKYLTEKKQITLLGIGFNKRKKNIGTYEVENI